MEFNKTPRGWTQHQSPVSYKKKEDNFSTVKESFPNKRHTIKKIPSKLPPLQWIVHHQDFMVGQNHHQNTS